MTVPDFEPTVLQAFHVDKDGKPLDIMNRDAKDRDRDRDRRSPSPSLRSDRPESQLILVSCMLPQTSDITLEHYTPCQNLH